MSNNWNEERAKERIKTQYEKVKDVTVVDYTKDMSLENIPVNKAYRMSAAHLYVDIVNLDEILGTTDVEGVMCHKRTLRFLNLHYRAVERILSESDARRVDFHNQRLHGVVAKPYGDDSNRERVCRAVAIGNLISMVLAETGEADQMIPNARVRIGIDTGTALVVNNGRHGNREPLFLGKPANIAAKCAAAGTETGIYLSNDARAAIEIKVLKDGADRTTALTEEEIAACEKEAALTITKDSIIKEWKNEQEDSPIGEVEFSRPTPPLKDLDIAPLSLANSKRFDGISIYADIDGFTAYVDAHIDENAEDVVRTLHVLRSEFDQVVSSDFGGRRIRFVGDCIHGCHLEGTSQTTDEDATLSNSVICAGGLRSSFAVALDFLKAQAVETGNLGLAIGLDFGYISISRLGIKGAKVRCAIGRCVLRSEAEQRLCSGVETRIGQAAYDKSNDAIQELFTDDRYVANLDYDTAVSALAAAGDTMAAKAEATVYERAKPAVVAGLSQPLRPHTH
jgi:class 3 adenylate cyclase